MKVYNVKILIFIFILIFIRLAGLQAQVVKDADGNAYPIVNIGKQVWMSENLKTTKFNDGKEIALVTDEKIWKALKTPAYCYLKNDIENMEVYGALYNWFTVNTKKLCPKGWHVPSDTEWGTMISFLGSANNAGNKLKETGTEHWKNILSTATDEFGFKALPGGMRSDSGVFPAFANSYSVWWSTTGSNLYAYNRGLYFESSRTYRGYEPMRSGFSVRCIKD